MFLRPKFDIFGIFFSLGVHNFRFRTRIDVKISPKFIYIVMSIVLKFQVHIFNRTLIIGENKKCFQFFSLFFHHFPIFDPFPDNLE